MTVVFEDIDAEVNILPEIEQPPYLPFTDLLYADDTLLMNTSLEALQCQLNIVIDVGRRYGLELNFKKVLHASINHDGILFDPNGNIIKKTDEVVYLGSLITMNGKAKSEISRRIGEATQVFYTLQSVWKHANITRQRKKEILDSMVISKLIYNLENLWLYAADRNRLDAFYCRCLRRIWNISPSYYSRISNEEVYRRTDAEKISNLLKRKQVKLYGRITILQNDNPL